MKHFVKDTCTDNNEHPNKRGNNTLAPYSAQLIHLMKHTAFCGVTQSNLGAPFKCSSRNTDLKWRTMETLAVFSPFTKHPLSLKDEYWVLSSLLIAPMSAPDAKVINLPPCNTVVGSLAITWVRSTRFLATPTSASKKYQNPSNSLPSSNGCNCFDDSP